MPSALSHSLFPAAVFDCHPTWSGKMPLLTPSSLSCHPTWSGKHHAAAYVLQGHATSIRPRSGNSRSPTTTPPPQKQNRNPHRLNIPEDSPSLPSQSAETFSQRGFPGGNPCDSTNGQEQLSRTRSRGGSPLRGVCWARGILSAWSFHPWPILSPLGLSGACGDAAWSSHPWPEQAEQCLFLPPRG